MKSLKKYPENMKKTMGATWKLQPNWAGLALLFSRQLLNSSQDFF
jgi:hypothetical protein